MVKVGDVFGNKRTVVVDRLVKPKTEEGDYRVTLVVMVGETHPQTHRGPSHSEFELICTPSEPLILNPEDSVRAHRRKVCSTVHYGYDNQVPGLKLV